MIRAPLLVLAFAIILLEETIWRWARALGTLLARIPLFAAIERLVPRLDAQLVLGLFLIPIALLFPVKLAALWLIGIGQAGLGLAAIVVAKLVGTALLARLFKLTQPALMQLGWFANAYTRWSVWKEAVLARVRASWAWRVGRVVKRRVAQRIARWRAAA